MAEYYVKELIVSLPLEKANVIVEGALKIGRENNMLPLTVSVWTPGGICYRFSGKMVQEF